MKSIVRTNEKNRHRIKQNETEQINIIYEGRKKSWPAKKKRTNEQTKNVAGMRFFSHVQRPSVDSLEKRSSLNTKKLVGEVAVEQHLSPMRESKSTTQHAACATSI